ncbi:glycoside hydrolase [Methylocystis sp. WRRC1]|uniref:sialidase family protein n=1 Tax=Methylocystis sp. WRRC1 TaxID=1732014 RepID=UPI001D14D643|nr:sialidase family protein [Methylocystis sp. WRRC1]MCC3243796.1 glycoside hydrolase [Methylocystis sp. WRRC1]
MRALEFGPYAAVVRNARLASIAVAAALIAAPVLAEEARPAGEPPPAAAGAAPAAQQGAGGDHARHVMRLPDGVVSLDVVADGAKLHLLTGKHSGSGTTIWHQISTDDGKSWSKEVEVQGPPGAGATVTRGSDARLASVNGKLVAMWMSHVADNPHGGAGPMIAARSEDGGKTWTPLAGPADWPRGPHSFFTLSSDGRTLHAAWLDSRDGPPPAPGAQGLRYAFSTDAGASWSKNLTLDIASCACCWTTSKADAAGNLYVLYRDKQPSDMAIGVVDPKSRQWTRLSTVGAFGWDFPGCPHIGGGLAIRGGKTPEIHAVVGTRKKENAGFYHLKSADGGKSWSEPQRLGDESATHGDIAIGKEGRLAAVFDMVDPEANDGTLAIYAATSSDDGASWTEAKRLSPLKITATHPRVVATKSGFLALWTEQPAPNEQRLAMKAIGTNLELGQAGAR